MLCASGRIRTNFTCISISKAVRSQSIWTKGRSEVSGRLLFCRQPPGSKSVEICFFLLLRRGVAPVLFT